LFATTTQNSRKCKEAKPLLHPWAQFGGGHGRRVPLTFSDRGNIICHVLPTCFCLGFVFGEVSKIKVMFVTFCEKSFSC